MINKEKLRYEVFPFELADGASIPSALQNGQLTAFIVHLAEGKPLDASSAREFNMFKKQGFLRKGVTIIHGVALSKREFKDMAGQGVGLVWSPRSNVELYGFTTDVLAAKNEKVTIALAPDWSPSGSNGMLEEMKYAAVWNAGNIDPDTNKPVFQDSEIRHNLQPWETRLAG